MLDNNIDIYSNVDFLIEILNTISDLVFLMEVDENYIFRYVFLNEQANKIIAPKVNPIGKTLHQVMHKNMADSISTQYKQAIAQRACVTYEDCSINWSEISNNMDETFISVKEFKCYESKVSPILNSQGECTHIIAIVRDITDRKLAIKKLKESEEKYRLIADNMSDLVSIIAPNGKLKYASPSYTYILGYNPENYKNKLAFDFIHPDDIKEISDKFSSLVEAKGKKTLEFRHKHSNGDWIWVEAKASAVLDENKNLFHILVVARDITERKLFEKKLKHMAYHDSLTGLPNRRFFKSTLIQAINDSYKTEKKLAVMYMDIDRFKIINDTLGHDIGDELLCQFSNRVKRCLRSGDLIARFGGDEFCILVTINEKEEAVAIAQRILRTFQKEWEIQTHRFYTTSSIGICFCENNSEDDETIIKNADKALYKAKESGRNNYKIFDSNESN